MIRPAIGISLLALAITAAPAVAQERADTIAEAYRPPPGMCRIWLDNVPPERQPAPTDCSTAIRRRPAGARVVFGIAKGATLPQARPAVPSPERPQPGAHDAREAQHRVPRSDPVPSLPGAGPPRATPQPPSARSDIGKAERRHPAPAPRRPPLPARPQPRDHPDR